MNHLEKLASILAGGYSLIQCQSDYLGEPKGYYVVMKGLRQISASTLDAVIDDAYKQIYEA